MDITQAESILMIVIVMVPVMLLSYTMFAAAPLVVGGLCGLFLRGLTLRRGLAYGLAVAGALTLTWWTVAFTPQQETGDWTWYAAPCATFAFCWQWSRAGRPVVSKGG